MFLGKLRGKSLSQLMYAIKRKYCIGVMKLKYGSVFKMAGKNSYIVSPILLLGNKNITFDSDVFVLNNARLESVFQYNNIKYSPLIYFGKHVTVQQNLHLTCANKIVIEEYAAIGANVTITDIVHPYEDVSLPVELQNIEVKSVCIGSGSKIYNNAVILPGVTIGKHCVIGANSVVTHSMPDYSVAVGSPAHVVRRYNFSSKQWEKTDKNGGVI